ncbi:hypothetical protein B0H10DRAFT_1778890 [Mycena sp. CBHHK59/15]|nr:hypothetical protein B0H10DRAFT_1778890 [Mycena sp. CBHHK59/15]
MSTSPTPKASSSGIHLTRDADFLIQSFLPPSESPPPFEPSGLPLPFCTPQLTPGFDSPFARGYNAALESIDISQDQLLAFIDGLNLAMTASPPLRVVSLAGMVIGFVPYHWAMIAGAAIQTAAKTGMRILSKTLTDRYLRAANLRLFKPRGLSVRICTTAAMQHLVMNTPIGAPPSKMKSFGRGVGTVLMKIPLPITSVLVHAVADKPPKVAAMDPNAYANNPKLLATQRRVAALEGHALPLDFNMPKPAKAEGVMDTMSSWGVKFDSWLDGRSQTRAEKRRLQLAQIEREEESEGGAHGQSRGVLSRGIGGGRGNDRSQLELQVADADLLEYWQSAKVLWVVIMSLTKVHQDIEGIELAESQDNEEIVDERTWHAEMNVEREELEFEEQVERVAAEQEKDRDKRA